MMTTRTGTKFLLLYLTSITYIYNIHTYIHTNLYSAKNRENESEALDIMNNMK